MCVSFLTIYRVEGKLAYIVARIRRTNPFDIPHGPDIYRGLG